MLENLTDEEFNNWYYFYNRYILYDYVYSYLSFNKDCLEPENEVIAERSFNKNDPQGNHLIKTIVNDSEIILQRILNIIYESYKSGNTPDGNELLIDSELIDNNLVIEFLRKCYDENLITSIKIIGDNFTLSEETYNRISFLNNIIVRNSEVSNSNITIESPKYVMVTGINSDFELEEDLILREDMTDEELQVIIDTINNHSNNINFKIDLRFYNPVLAVELIERLDNLGLSDNIGIKILGYTLTENSDMYKRLIPIANKRNIEVYYVCCHDLLGKYTNEPFLVDNFYDSELEPSGKTDLLTYIKILEFIENFEKSVEGVSSNIEKIMMAYQFLNNNYYYDVDSGDTKEYGATRDIDKILNTDQIVCTGYANLLCIMCRRIGIPMFTYDAPNHSANIARVQEKDENGNIILDKICTFDPTNDSGYYQKNNNIIERIDQKDSYIFFGLNPEKTLHNKDQSAVSFITLANALSIQPEELLKFLGLSSSPYFGSYFSHYNAFSYMYSMLHLMGYNYDINTNVFDLISELQERGRIGEIPQSIILETARRIERKKHPEMTEEEFNQYMEEITSRITTSFISRNRFYDMSQPAKIYLNKNDFEIDNIDNYIEEVLTYSNGIPDHEIIDIDAIDMGPVYYQDLNNLNIGEIKPTEPEPSEVIDPVEPDPSLTPSEVIDPVEPDPLPTPSEVTDPVEPDPLPEPSEVIDPVESVSTPIETPEQVSLGNMLGNNGIVINGNVHIGGNINITINNYGQNPANLGNTTIAGTTIRRPKPRKNDETQIEYDTRIDNYNRIYLPQAIEETKKTYRLTKNQIIQDLPIYANIEQNFNATGMSDEEIENSRRKLR